MRIAAAARFAWGMCVLACALGLSGAAQAQDKASAHNAAQVAQLEQLPHAEKPSPAAAAAQAMQFTVEGGWLVLRAQLPLSLPENVAQAMVRGIPVQLRAQFWLQRERWWWRDALWAHDVRHYRLSHQPLTRRWRTQTLAETGATAGRGLTLSSTYESLDAALGAIGRVVRWPIAPVAELPDAALRAQLRVEFDAAQLPRTLQIHARGEEGWTQMAALQTIINPHQVALLTSEPKADEQDFEQVP